VAYTQTIELGLSDSQTWSGRGTAYGMLRQYESAATDYALGVKKQPGIY